MNEQTYENTEYPIVIENISKTYRIAHRDTELIRSEHESIKDAIVRVAKKPLKLADSHYGRTRETFYALDDVSFKIKKGQVMAVMGKNGSGKSTLFKILARVTSPSSGTATVTGRVGSLLEVGAGFHPELTGRENVYFNGSILGMKKSEIKTNFDSILEFAEMDKFIDTPVKFYSSGMRTRLAFSIAIHLDCDVLLLDEVLAVGDYNFRMKCFDKMGEIAKQGKTILFVSHMPAHIRRICTHGVLLREGKLVFEGGVEETIAEYLEDIKEDTSMDEDESDDKKDTKSKSPEPANNVEITDVKSEVAQKKHGTSVSLRVSLKNISSNPVDNIRVRVLLCDSEKQKIAALSSTMKGDAPLTLQSAEESSVVFTIPNANLSPGEYSFQVSAQENDGEKTKFHQLKEVGEFKVADYNPLNINALPTKQTLGPIVFDFECEIE